MVRKLLLFTILFVTTLIGTPSVTLDLSGVRYLRDASGKLQATAFLGEPFTLQATVVGGRERVRVEGLEPFIRQGTSQSSNISVENTKMLVEQTFAYTLLPKKEGSFVIGPASTRVDGKFIESNKITISVQRRPHDLSAKGENATDDTTPYEIFCELRTEKSKIFVEEPTVVTISIYHRGSGYGIRGIVPPQFPHCTVKEEKNMRQFKEDRDGITYSVLQKRFLVFPSTPGPIEVEPARAVYTVKNAKQRDDFFTSFFAPQQRQLQAISNPLSFNVENIPTGKEAQGIGTFSRFAARCDKTTADINEPITLTLELEGRANFDLILPPPLSLPDNFKSYDSKAEFLPGRNLAQGTKKFSFIIQVPEQGQWTIPAQAFSYFDTAAKRFQILKTAPITLTIKMPSGYTPPPTKATPQPSTPPQNITLDIAFIQEDFSVTSAAGMVLPLWLLLMLMLLVPGILYADVLITSLRLRLSSRRKNILFTYQRKITDAIEYNELGSLYSLFLGFISEKTGLAQHEVTLDQIGRLLSGSEHREKFQAFLQACAQYSFASTDRVKDMVTLRQEALEWLRFLNQTL